MTALIVWSLPSPSRREYFNSEEITTQYAHNWHVHTHIYTYTIPTHTHTCNAHTHIQIFHAQAHTCHEHSHIICTLVHDTRVCHVYKCAHIHMCRAHVHTYHVNTYTQFSSLLFLSIRNHMRTLLLTSHLQEGWGTNGQRGPRSLPSFYTKVSWWSGVALNARISPPYDLESTPPSHMTTSNLTWPIWKFHICSAGNPFHHQRWTC